MKKIILISIILLVVMGGIVWSVKQFSQNKKELKYATSSTPNLKGTLTSKETFFDFGEISMTKGNLSHQFKIKNNGEEPLRVEKIYTSCICTKASFKIKGETLGPYGFPNYGAAPKINKILQPQEEAVVEIIFDPGAHGPLGIGRIQKIVYLENNGGKTLDLTILATVTP